MRSARIGWATCLLLGGVAVSLSGCLTRTKTVPVAGPVSVQTKTQPNIAQQLLSESDYGTSGSKIKAAVDAKGMFYFNEVSSENSDDCATPSADATCIKFDVDSIFASQGSAMTADVDFGDKVNSLQFIKVVSNSATKDATTDEAFDAFTETTHTEMAEYIIPISKLTGSPMAIVKKGEFSADPEDDDYGRKGTRYNISHNLQNGNVIALFATESKYLTYEDYDSDDDDAEMFAGGYWVEISQDTDETKNIVNAGVFSDAKGLVRGNSGRWALQWDSDYTNAQDQTDDDEVTATYSGKTEGGYSHKDGAGGFSGDIELKAKLFGENATARVGTEPEANDFVRASAGTVDGTIKGIKLYTFQDFGKDPKSLSGTVKLGATPISEMGTMNGSVMIGTVSKGKWSGIFSNTTVTLNAPAFVLGTYGFEHTQDSVERAFLGHFGLAHPDVATD